MSVSPTWRSRPKPHTRSAAPRSTLAGTSAVGPPRLVALAPPLLIDACRLIYLCARAGVTLECGWRAVPRPRELSFKRGIGGRGRAQRCPATWRRCSGRGAQRPRTLNSTTRGCVPPFLAECRVSSHRKPLPSCHRLSWPPTRKLPFIHPSIRSSQASGSGTTRPRWHRLTARALRPVVWRQLHAWRED